MPNHRWRREAREALAEAGLEAYAGDTVGNLPYGIRKRIELVRATLPARSFCCSTSRPPDSIRRKPTRCALISIFSGRVASRFWSSSTTCISSAMLCGHVMVLNFGEKIAEGTLAHVQSDERVRDAYLGTEETV